VREELDARDERFVSLVGGEAKLEKLWTGSEWGEGPVYFAEGDFLVWSDIPKNRMLRWSEAGVSVFRQPSNFANGNTRDNEGRLVTCEHGTRRVSRTERDGRIVTVVDNYKGKRLNSPNDVVVRADGTIWFTDPTYGIQSDRQGYKAQSELDANYVFRFDPRSADLAIVADDFDQPNGIAFSPDESILYVADSGGGDHPGGPCHIRAFDVDADACLTNGRVFAEIDAGNPDGFRIDTDNNLYAAAFDGVHVFSPAGELLGKILVPETVANCAFGGPVNTRLFITASTSLYAIGLNARGC
jgi:gluconolactonase